MLPFFVYFMAAFKVFTHCAWSPRHVELSTWTSRAAAVAVAATSAEAEAAVVAALAKVAIK